jgi:hypothetical protein
MVFFDGLALYISIAGFGFAFGFLFNLLIIGVEHLKARHSIIAGIFIPLLAVLDIVLIIRIIGLISAFFDTPPVFNMPMIVAVFITSFVIPYLVSVVTGHHRL